jgi:hypothetical protein
MYFYYCVFFVSLSIVIVIYVSVCVFCPIVLFCVLFVCKCVMNYCHRVSTQLQLTNISYVHQIRVRHLQPFWHTFQGLEFAVMLEDSIQNTSKWGKRKHWSRRGWIATWDTVRHFKYTKTQQITWLSLNQHITSSGYFTLWLAPLPPSPQTLLV